MEKYIITITENPDDSSQFAIDTNLEHADLVELGAKIDDDPDSLTGAEKLFIILTATAQEMVEDTRPESEVEV